MTIVAITSRSFSNHPELRKAIQAKYPDVKFNESAMKFNENQIVKFLKGAEKAIIGLDAINESIVSQLPDLKVIVKFGVGLDKIDIPVLRKYNIALANTPGENKRSVAELVLGLVITIFRQLHLSYDSLIKSDFRQHKGNELFGKSIGIIGFGSVGKEVAKIFTALGCRCFAYDVIVHKTKDYTVEFCNSLEELLTFTDIVTLHLPLNKFTYHILNRDRLSLLKRNAILINTARGGLVDEEGLTILLEERKVAAAAFDVFEQEPPISSKLLKLSNFFGTCHIGGSTEEAILAMGNAAIAALETAKIPSEEVVV